MSDAVAPNADYLDRWQKPGDETNTYVPSIVFPPHSDANRSQFYQYSSSLIEKGDHIRLQDINLTYSINPNHKTFSTIKAYRGSSKFRSNMARE